MNAKPTLATLKSFVRKNREQLLIKESSSFDGMIDCVSYNQNAQFGSVVAADREFANNMGMRGVWLVFGSRDRISPFEQDGLSGYSVYNCCGSFTLAVRK